MGVAFSGDTVGLASANLTILEPQEGRENYDLHKRICSFGCEVILETRNQSHIRTRDKGALGLRHAETKFTLQGEPHKVKRSLT